ncbi:MAG TPA: Nif3-like dinuclear metal center hexameric protein [Opitutaceae bacterium]|nr:Nif3-like dinuclear metal center hexameric protein [Opitutaceae bacterium]
MPAPLAELVAHCHQRLGLPGFPDFPGAHNGLQLENNGTVTRLGAAVDAGLHTFRAAAAAGVDFLIVHHGLLWDGARPIVGAQRERLQVAFAANLAVYSAHLPLDAHPELGNNAVLARTLSLSPVRGFLPYQGRDMGIVATAPADRATLRALLETTFPGGVTALEFGSKRPREIALLTGSGMSALDALAPAGLDTFITGELKQSVYNRAQEEQLNLYLCGHYATEVFGVQALAAELAARFGLPWVFLPSNCPL